MHAAVFRQDNKIDHEEHEVHEEKNLYQDVFVLFVCLRGEE